MTFLELADPGFSVTSDEVHRARERCWYAHTSYGLAVLRHDQASRLIRHPNVRQGSSAWPAHHGITSGLFADWWAGWVLNKEGADHQRLRRLLNPAFSRRLVAAMEPRFRMLAGELVDSFAEPDRCEFMTEFAEPYAARVIAIMLGIPEREWPVIARDSATIGLAMGVRIRQNLEQIEAALGRLYAYADALIADRRATPREDCVTSLVRAHAEHDRLSQAELRDTLVLLMFGGFDTTRNQLGLGMQAFVDHPAAMAAARAASRPGARRGRGGHADPPHHDLGYPGGPRGLHLRRACHQGRHHHSLVLRVSGYRPPGGP